MNDSGLTKIVDFTVWKSLFSYASHHKKSFISLMLVMIVFALVEVAVPTVIGIGIDQIAVAESLDLITWLVIIFLIIAILRGYLVSKMIQIGGTLNHTVVYEIRNDAFAKLQEMSFSYFDHKPIGWLISRLTSDCQTLGNTLSWGIVDIIWGLAMMVFMAVIMLIMNWKLCLIVLTIVPVIFAISYFFKSILLVAYRKVREANSLITSAVNESIMGARTIKTLVHEDSSQKEFEKLTQNMRDLSVSAATKSSLYLPLILLISSVGTFLTLYFGSQGLLETGNQLGISGVTFGVLVSFMSFTVKFFQPIQDVARRFSELQNAQASAERVLGILQSEPEISNHDDIVVPLDHKGHIAINNLSFSYMTGEQIFNNFSLEIKPQECIAIVGETGSGKSTLTNILARFYEPTSGEILFDGIDYRKLPLEWIQEQLGMVLQTPHLFRGTIAENVAYGRENYTLDEVKQACRLVKADSFIEKLPEQYNFELGESGSGLSLGQKQLLTFARAILVDPSIMILDEATAAIDTQTEALIQEATNAMLHNRTSIVVAHRLSTIRHATKIIVLKAGEIVESGSHNELIRQRGAYYKLYTTQFQS